MGAQTTGAALGAPFPVEEPVVQRLRATDGDQSNTEVHNDLRGKSPSQKIMEGEGEISLSAVAEPLQNVFLSLPPSLCSLLFSPL